VGPNGKPGQHVSEMLCFEILLKEKVLDVQVVVLSPSLIQIQSGFLVHSAHELMVPGLHEHSTLLLVQLSSSAPHGDQLLGLRIAGCNIQEMYVELMFMGVEDYTAQELIQSLSYLERAA